MKNERCDIPHCKNAPVIEDELLATLKPVRYYGNT